MLDGFCNNLAFGDQDGDGLSAALEVLGDQEEAALEQFVTHVHDNIAYYQTKLKRELNYRNWWIIATVVMLAVTPLLVFLYTWLGHWILSSRVDSGVGFGAANVTAIGTAVLTSIIALHRFLTGWFNKRRFVATLHEASSELKELLFGFEDKWRPRDLSKDDEKRKFLADLRAKVKKARAIVRKERRAYFAAKSEVPNVDIGSALTSARTAAVSIFTGHQAPAHTHSLQRAEALRRRADELDDAKRSLEVDVGALQRQMRNIQAALEMTDDKTRRAELREQLEALDQKLAEVRDSLYEAQLEAGLLRGHG
ncbi:MAG: hypothetical protein MJB57_05670 [Gemmatimonadetes bacterium]|nr:hypothetical protein [Gemmatimonadota bacterium]